MENELNYIVFFADFDLDDFEDKRAIRKLKRKYLLEFELHKSDTIEVNGNSYTKNDVIDFFDKIEKWDENIETQYIIYKNKHLQRLLIEQDFSVVEHPDLLKEVENTAVRSIVENYLVEILDQKLLNALKSGNWEVVAQTRAIPFLHFHKYSHYELKKTRLYLNEISEDAEVFFRKLTGEPAALKRTMLFFNKIKITAICELPSCFYFEIHDFANALYIGWQYATFGFSRYTKLKTMLTNIILYLYKQDLCDISEDTLIGREEEIIEEREKNSYSLRANEKSGCSFTGFWFMFGFIMFILLLKILGRFNNGNDNFNYKHDYQKSIDEIIKQNQLNKQPIIEYDSLLGDSLYRMYKQIRANDSNSLKIIPQKYNIDSLRKLNIENMQHLLYRMKQEEINKKMQKVEMRKPVFNDSVSGIELPDTINFLDNQ